LSKKILYIVPHRLDRSPGQRFRCEQYLQFLQAEGYDINYSNLLNEREDALFYSKGKYLQKFLIFLKSFILRTKDVFRANRYDIIFIYREAIMVGSTLFERLFKLSKAKIIFDFDDSIWLNDTSDGNQSLQWLKRPSKTATICRLADVVIVGNEYLAQYARNHSKNVVVIPTTIDTNYHSNDGGYTKRQPVCIGWTGTATTLKHFESMLPALISIKKKYGNGVCFKMIINTEYKNSDLDLIASPWKLESEISDLSSIDIGIMPLPNDSWSQGKCGFKGLQYMSLGIPTIMSPFGVNNEIISDGTNGFLALTDEDWIDRLSFLIENPSVRVSIGKQGQNTIIERYSVESQKVKYISLFNCLL
jgi:glycosyltransferase involved in cell wall biosynthesis